MRSRHRTGPEDFGLAAMSQRSVSFAGKVIEMSLLERVMGAGQSEEASTLKAGMDGDVVTSSLRTTSFGAVIVV